MTSPLRDLLVQRSARLQERPALTTPDWGTLNYFQFRNRIEGVALGLMAEPPNQGGTFACTGTPWDWICEVAVACCGLRWDPNAPPVGEAILGGPLFNNEAGRQSYHDCEHEISPATPFWMGLCQGGLLYRLQQLNGQLGWDHTTELRLPLSTISSTEGQWALWSALFAGAHTELSTAQTWVSSVEGAFRFHLDRVNAPRPSER